MRDFFESLKADLTSRRFLPALIALGVLLLAAIAYAVLGGGSSSSSSTPATAPVSASTHSTGIVVTKASVSPNKAIAETTAGAPNQKNNVKNPFKAQTSTSSSNSSKSSKPASSSSSSASKSSSGSSGSGAGGSGSSSGGAGSSGSSRSSSSGSSSGGSSSSGSGAGKSQPAQPATVYHVDVKFGPGASASDQAAQLKPYEDLARSTRLPNSSEPLISYAGAVDGGRVASFALLAEIIPHGPGECLPSAAQCLAVGLKVGQTEQLEYLPPSGAPVLYELQLVSVNAEKASAARAARAKAARARVARARRARAARHAHAASHRG